MADERRTPIILLVDDEEMALSSLRALFDLETDYTTVAFTDPVAAIEEARRRPIDLVISDYLMPRMSGIELLKQLKQIQPEMVQILLTGFADKENTIRAINELDVFQYLEKPWDNQQLLLIVERGLQQRSLRRQLTAKMEELDRLLAAHRELERRHTALARELEMAARVQRSLLPASIPDTLGYHFTGLYRPCEDIGGDFYGFNHRDGRATLLLADVSGHGIQAALTSMLLKAIFEENSATAEGAPSMVEQMNDALHRFLPDSMYAAATVAWIPAENGRLQLVNGGNPYPILLRSSQRRVDEIPVSGMPLGIFGRGGPATFDSSEIELAPGDVLLLGSDGIGDVQSAADDDVFFRDQELGQNLSELAGEPGDIVVERLLERATRFAGGRPLPDDISLVAITKLG